MATARLVNGIGELANQLRDADQANIELAAKLRLTEARVRELEGLLDNERLYAVEHKGYAQAVGRENEALQARVRELTEALERRDAAINRALAVGELRPQHWDAICRSVGLAAGETAEFSNKRWLFGETAE